MSPMLFHEEFRQLLKGENLLKYYDHEIFPVSGQQILACPVSTSETTQWTVSGEHDTMGPVWTWG